MNKHYSPGLIVFIILSSLLFFNSCSRDHNTADSEFVFSAKLVKPADAVDLEKRLKAELVRRYERMYSYTIYYAQYGMMGGSEGGTAGGSIDDGGLTGVTSGADSTNTSVLHSETNNQEQGVDEGDIVKTNGNYIYLARGSHFLILKAIPADQTSIVSNIDLGEPISELHLSGSLLSLVSSTYHYEVQTASAGIAPIQSTYFTHVSLYNIATPESPILTNDFLFPWMLQGSRRIKDTEKGTDTIYLVLNHSINLAFPASPWTYMVYPYYYDYTTAAKKALDENLKKIDSLTINDLLPSYTSTPYTAGEPGSPFTGPLVNYQDVYIPEFGNGTDLSIVISLDISRQNPSPASSAVLSSWCRMYMNTESLYLASDNNWWWIEPIMDTAAPQNPEPRTAVHKFSVNTADGKPLYRGSAVVDGWVNDRFSMSDYLGYLRIGTTRGGWWGENISNQLAVMEENDGNLVETGKLTGLAPGERIFSMRYDGDRGYMVTYRQTDPLFTLDLSDPKNPKVAGEIKVNGFATYIHLIGGETKRLLTIGPSADETGRLTGGNKLQLFNVTDLTTPTILATQDLGQGWSDAVYDPHAFLYYEPLNLLTIPYYSYTYTAGTYTYSSGLSVFSIGSGTITPRGMISAPTITSGYGTNYSDTVDRSVIISTVTGTVTESNIFSIAHRSVTATGADLLDVKKVVELPESYSYYYPCCWVGTGIGDVGVGIGGGGGVAVTGTMSSVQIPEPVSVITTTTASTEPAQPTKIE